jgi:hypothetical protein
MVEWNGATSCGARVTVAGHQGSCARGRGRGREWMDLQAGMAAGEMYVGRRRGDGCARTT